MPYTCPACEMTSHHPKDEEHRYCGNCHEFEGARRDLLVIRVLQGEQLSDIETALLGKLNARLGPPPVATWADLEHGEALANPPSQIRYAGHQYRRTDVQPSQRSYKALWWRWAVALGLATTILLGAFLWRLT